MNKLLTKCQNLKCIKQNCLSFLGLFPQTPSEASSLEFVAQSPVDCGVQTDAQVNLCPLLSTTRPSHYLVSADNDLWWFVCHDRCRLLLLQTHISLTLNNCLQHNTMRTVTELFSGTQ